MKTFRSKHGPFLDQPYFEFKEIERICLNELQNVGLLPQTPGAIRIERFIEKRFNIVPIYDDVPSEVLGYTRFGAKGVEAIIVSRDLEEKWDEVSRRRANTTLAHEAGHGLLHTDLFSLVHSDDVATLFGPEFDASTLRILCRDENIAGGRQEISQGRYDGRWWEFQANQAMSALLLPCSLVIQCVDSFLVNQGMLGGKVLEEVRREEAVRQVSAVFDVNPVVGRIRLQEIFPIGDAHQLTF